MSTISARELRRIRRAQTRAGLTPTPRRVRIDDEEEKSIKLDGERGWFCRMCPIRLTTDEEMRALAPCGHLFCADCVVGISVCPLLKCNKDVAMIVIPKIQQNEIDGPSTSKEADLKEHMKLEKSIQKIEKQISESIKKKRHLENTYNARMDLLHMTLDDIKQAKSNLESKIKELKIKAAISEFLNSIETDPNPVQKDPTFRICPTQKIISADHKLEIGRSVFRMAANLLYTELVNENAKLSHEIASQKRELTRQKAAFQVFNTSLNEVRENDGSQDTLSFR